jgi:hypothetical protein
LTIYLPSPPYHPQQHGNKDDEKAVIGHVFAALENQLSIALEWSSEALCKLASTSILKEMSPRGSAKALCSDVHGADLPCDFTHEELDFDEEALAEGHRSNVSSANGWIGN